jgi:WD40 repeat protein
MSRKQAFLVIFVCSLLPLVALAQGAPRTLTGPKGTVWAVAFSADGKLVAAASDISEKTTKDGKEVTFIKGSAIHIWDTQKGELKNTLTVPNMQLSALAFTPDGKMLASGGFKEARIWDVQSGEVKHTLKDHVGTVKRVAIPRDGKSLITMSSWFDKCEVRIYELPTGKLLRTINDEGCDLAALGVSADGKIIATGSRVSKGAFRGDVKIYDAQTGTLKRTMSEPKNWVNALALSPDGKTVAYPSDFTIKFCDTGTGQVKRTVKDFVSTLEFMSDGKIVIGMIPSGQDSSDLKLIDANTGRVTKTIKARHKGLGFFALSPDGKLLAVGSGEAGQGSVQLIEMARAR